MESLSEIDLKRSGTGWFGSNADCLIRTFFGGNAALAMIILLMICFFLVKEAMYFFPDYRTELELHRKTGGEVTTLVRQYLDRGRVVLNEIQSARDLEEAETAADLVRRRDLYNQFAGRLDVLAADSIDAWYDAKDALEEAGEQEQEGARQSLEAAVSGYQATVAREFAGLDTHQTVSDPATREWLQSALLERTPDGADSPRIIDLEKSIQRHLGPFDRGIATMRKSSETLESAWQELRGISERNRSIAEDHRTAEDRRNALLEGAAALSTSGQHEKAEHTVNQANAISLEAPDYEALTAPIHDKLPDIITSIEEMAARWREAAAGFPAKPVSRQAASKLARARDSVSELDQLAAACVAQLSDWRHDRDVPLSDAIFGFFTGKDWQTNAALQDRYGLLPLLAGSMVISLLALLFAVPLAICGAIYVNQIGTSLEQSCFKPIIEFIQAIPSVVLGFFGITVLGEGIFQLGQLELLSWIPGFPMESRLNIITASLLLALMAIPTMFTLAEDALNNVPRTFRDASIALGASRLQTTLRVVTPAATSGMIAAVLLGFGRVIGETMVVLLVAGNRIEIPDFTKGIALIFEPAHTMTGIIAQETGETGQGSLHWRALFMVGLVLFFISLATNFTAQRVLRRFSRSFKH